jgi:hypothetical protein
MIGRLGWTTAATRTSGNDSSACRYKTGASWRASWAPLSSGDSAAGGDDGNDGRRRRGPHARGAHSTIARSTSRPRTVSFLSVT